MRANTCLALHVSQHGGACHCIIEYIAEQGVLLCTSVSTVHAADRNLCGFVNIVSSQVCRWRPEYPSLQQMSFADEHRLVCPQ